MRKNLLYVIDGWLFFVRKIQRIMGLEIVNLHSRFDSRSINLAHFWRGFYCLVHVVLILLRPIKINKSLLIKSKS